MAVFFLHIDNGAGFDADEDGRDFVDADSAIFEAARAVGDIFSEDVQKGGMTCQSRFIFRIVKASWSHASK
ncbi:DUF6894 family protein [Sphingomonas sp.]|uniref:DUF6894 family protein n=1 Tax=Sphingomonas sp. TaxID=28214 RepID=UPI003D6C8BC7